MALELTKGANVSLSKEAPGMKKIIVGLGWDVNDAEGHEFDLDASAFLLGSNGKCASDSDLVFYKQLTSQDGSITHTGDNRTGEGDGDDEQIIINLDQVPATVETIAIAVTIHDAKSRGQNFGQVRNAQIRIVNADTNEEVVKYDLTEDYSTQTAIVFGELYKRNNEWKFKAVGAGHTADDPLAKMCEQYGLITS